MKKVLGLVAVTGLMAASTAAFGGSIVNSKHNLSPTGIGNSTYQGLNSQVCVYCHAPHRSTSSLPLWNRNNPAANTFTLYSGVNMQSRQFATGFTTDSTSLFCMSCHDGTLKMDQIYNVGALRNNASLGGAGDAGLSFGGATIGSNANLGTNLMTTHPVNFPVPSVNNNQNDLFLGSPTASSMGGGFGTKTDQFPLFKTSSPNAGRVSARSLECGSCHAVHDSTISPFLRATMDKSTLCLGCHNK